MVYKNILMVAASVCVGFVSSDDPPFDVRDFALFAPDIIETDRSYFNAPPNDYSSRERFDVIIVGAGTAGSVLASRLTENSDCSVLVLEAGEEETLFNDVPLLWFFSRPVSDWNYTTVPMENGCPRGLEGRCPYPRGKVLGGSSSTNLMAYLRGNPGDFDDLAKELDDGSWSYDRMLEYFKKGENMTIPELRNSRYHSTEGAIEISYLPFKTKITQAVLDAAQEMGIPEIDYNGAQQEGVSRIQTFSSNGNRFSASRGYLWPAAKRQNLYLRLRSFVTQILFDDAGVLPPLTRGVRYERDGKIREAYAKGLLSSSHCFGKLRKEYSACAIPIVDDANEEEQCRMYDQLIQCYKSITCAACGMKAAESVSFFLRGILRPYLIVNCNNYDIAIASTVKYSPATPK